MSTSTEIDRVIKGFYCTGKGLVLIEQKVNPYTSGKLRYLAWSQSVNANYTIKECETRRFSVLFIR